MRPPFCRSLCFCLLCFSRLRLCFLLVLMWSSQKWTSSASPLDTSASNWRDTDPAVCFIYNTAPRPPPFAKLRVVTLWKQQWKYEAVCLFVMFLTELAADGTGAALWHLRHNKRSYSKVLPPLSSLRVAVCHLLISPVLPPSFVFLWPIHPLCYVREFLIFWSV